VVLNLINITLISRMNANDANNANIIIICGIRIMGTSVKISKVGFALKVHLTK